MELFERMPPSPVEVEAGQIASAVSVDDPIYIDHWINSQLKVPEQPADLVVLLFK